MKTWHLLIETQVGDLNLASDTQLRLTKNCHSARTDPNQDKWYQYTLSDLYKHLFKNVLLPPTDNFLSQTIVSPMALSIISFECSYELLTIWKPLSPKSMSNSIPFGWTLVSEKKARLDGGQIKIGERRWKISDCFVFNTAKNNPWFFRKIAFKRLSFYALGKNKRLRQMRLLRSERVSS